MNFYKGLKIIEKIDRLTLTEFKNFVVVSALKAAGSLSELSRQTGIRRQTISRWVNQKKAMPLDSVFVFVNFLSSWSKDK